MQAHPRNTDASREPRLAGRALGLMVLAGAACAFAFVALIHAPLPEESVLASLGHAATAEAVGSFAPR